MKSFYRSILGVTLLEIMLVLAIAAMIIVMSIRYYQSASNSQQANAAMGQIQNIMAAMDNLSMNSGYSNTATVNTANLTAIVGSANMVSPVGGSISMTAQSATGYTLAVPLSVPACTLLQAKMAGNTKITGASCSSTGTYSFTYDSTK